MSRTLSSLAVIGLGTAVSLVLTNSPVIASSVSVNDTYYGGRDIYQTVPNTNNGVNSTNFPNQDVIANATDPYFQIQSADLTRTGSNLQVVIHTNYANSVAANSITGQLGTQIGALFLGNGSPIYNNGVTSAPVVDASGHYVNDVFTLNPGRFGFADAPSIGAGNAKIGTVYSLNGTGSDVVTSNYPSSADNYRANQAVGVKNTAALLAGVTSTWSLGVGTITFNLANIFGAGKLDDTFTFAWAMTCANDIILETVTLPCDTCAPPPGETPLPGALSLFAGGLGVLGFLGNRRKRRMAKSAA
jgi:hypothetical protein